MGINTFANVVNTLLIPYYTISFGLYKVERVLIQGGGGTYITPTNQLHKVEGVLIQGRGGTYITPTNQLYNPNEVV